MGAKTLLTVEQLEQLPEIDDISYELDQGELVEVPSTNLRHNWIRGKSARLLGNHLEAHKGQGIILEEQRFRLAEDIVRGPDVALIGPEQLRLLDWDKWAQAFAPTLVIEVTSPSNTVDRLAKKIRQYLEAGVRTVWIIVTPMREIHVYAAGARPKILCTGDALEEPTLLPGFSVRVADLFPDESAETF